MSPPWQAVIGLEVHIRLATRTKMFCRCENRYGAAPNSLVCPICLGYPGTLPMPNRRAVELALRLARALDAQLAPRSVFARKSYFYPDLPKGYQITQDEEPLARGGRLPFIKRAGAVVLRRLHLEEDAGKSVESGDEILVDFNRAGVPLVELVTEPVLEAPDEAQDALRSLQQVVRELGVSDANLDEGGMRCDANVSVRRPGEPLGARVEVKNLNSFRFVARALEHEIERQISVREAGAEVDTETRGYDEHGRTYVMRGKEDAADYRYFPEPDLPPLMLDAALLDESYSDFPELPWDRRARVAETLGVTADEARLLAETPALASYAEHAVATYPENPQGVVNLLLNTWRRQLDERGVGDLGNAVDRLDGVPAASTVARIVALVDTGTLSSSAAKTVLEALWDEPDTDPVELAQRLGVVQENDETALLGWIETALEENSELADAYRRGKTQLLGFFVGEVMKRSSGRADPQAVQRLLRDRFENPVLS
ncbi:MAG: Asp-tRNA(Asn)/Glu-tRNA(Gln) amidotransferase subunit GatB [Acidobacteriota bacterium]